MPCRTGPALFAGAFALLAALAPSPAPAGASPAPFDYVPNPALRNATPAQLQERVRAACIATQAKVQGVAETEVGTGCACYARRTMSAFDREELANYRTRGYFDDTGREKALAATAACGLKRPI